MKSRDVRQSFLDFFKSKQHAIVPSAPIVNKDDPTLMFTNAGMNQFKDYFLGNKVPQHRRVTDTQKCLRVSGKHNDLEEVGFDGTHHTMFEMLGNWSFGDYFKKEAISWSWEYLADVCQIPKERLYATIFEGDEKEGLERDTESYALWNKVLPDNRIINGNKKDNFWEMGDTGPCGPCTEIHVDLRTDEDRAKIPGESLVNKDHPLVVEIWNNVFIQYNRKADRSLESLPERHVDTGMGFERLCMVLQGKDKSYDTDVFTPFIQFIESRTGKKYTASYDPNAKSDVAMRVMADHIRAVAFTIADGELPGNGGAGYVIRRILRRAVRYYYSFLDQKEPILYALVHILADEMGDVFPEIQQQREFISKVVLEEEKGFLRTLAEGLSRIEALDVKHNLIDGNTAFELYDTYGFPIDLTRLIASEQGWQIDEAGFEAALAEQKQRSRADSKKEIGDWHEIQENKDLKFLGYDTTKVEGAFVVKYRTVLVKSEPQYQLVLSETPFYGESGGQTGDRGQLEIGSETLIVSDTKKENELIVHIVNKLPESPNAPVTAKVDDNWRRDTSSNHSAVHLMHAALHRVVGKHANQKGQDVNNQRLRFDFSHFQKLSDAELESIENTVNEKVRLNIALDEQRDVPIEEAREIGAMMLFGEKYGDKVRVVTFEKGFSSELCGGTHVAATGQIGLFKITSESAVAAGVRRIEAVTGVGAKAWVDSNEKTLSELKEVLKAPKDIVVAVQSLQEDLKKSQKDLEKLQLQLVKFMKSDLLSQAESVQNFKTIITDVGEMDGKAVKELASQLLHEIGSGVIVLGSNSGGKPQLSIAVSNELSSKFHAGNMVKELAVHVKGGGGGQAGYATAGGTDPEGLPLAIAAARKLIADS